MRYICLSMSFEGLSGAQRSEAISFVELAEALSARYGYALRRPRERPDELLIRNASLFIAVPIEWDDLYPREFAAAADAGIETVVLWPSFRSMRAELFANDAVRLVYTWRRLGPAYETLKTFLRDRMRRADAPPSAPNAANAS